MGITISYRGRLDDGASLPALVGELASACNELGWPCKHVETLLTEGMETCAGLRGISLQTHPRCEWLHLHVDHEGYFTNHFYWALLRNSDHAARISAMLDENQRAVRELLGEERSAEERGCARDAPVRVIYANSTALDPAEGARYNWVKTQHAGSTAHVAVCRVLAHIKERYAPDLMVDDESGFFDHRDITKLERSLAEVDLVLHGIRRTIERIPAGSVQTPADLIARLEQALGGLKEDLH